MHVAHVCNRLTRAVQVVALNAYCPRVWTGPEYHGSCAPLAKTGQNDQLVSSVYLLRPYSLCLFPIFSLPYLLAVFKWKRQRLVILRHVDPFKPRVVNEAPTVLKSSIRLAVSLIPSHGFKTRSRDIPQAFLQIKDPLRRTVYVMPAKGEDLLRRIGAPPGSLLHAIKSQYGLTDTPGYWCQTFRRWHTDGLHMKPSVLDPCLS